METILSGGRKVLFACLNRTMQYGNRIVMQSFFSEDSPFKSYYVVWKLHMTVIKNIAQAKFKSYYVVWKPKWLQGENGTEIQFKSYYVVWKLFFENENIRPQSCLNRTMQYGNEYPQLFWFEVQSV